VVVMELGYLLRETALGCAGCLGLGLQLLGKSRGRQR
jgi:hypothetical protein